MRRRREPDRDEAHIVAVAQALADAVERGEHPERSRGYLDATINFERWMLRSSRHQVLAGQALVVFGAAVAIAVLAIGASTGLFILIPIYTFVAYRQGAINAGCRERIVSSATRLANAEESKRILDAEETAG